MAETLWKGGNVPVALGGITVVRAQNFQVTRRRTIEEVYELGVEQPVGVDEGPTTHTGVLTWFPIDVETENALVGVASQSAAVNLSDIMGMTPVALQGVSNTKGIVNAVPVSLEYTVQVNGRWQATLNLRGRSWDADGDAVTPDTPTGTAAYRSKHIMVQFEDSAVTLERIRRLDVRINLRADEAYELHNADPFDVEMLSPSITGVVEWYANYESGGAGSHSYRPLPDIGDDENIIIQIGTGAWDAVGNIRMTLYNMVYQLEDWNVRVQQRGFHRIEYRSGGDNTTFGWKIEKITV